MINSFPIPFFFIGKQRNILKKSVRHPSAYMKYAKETKHEQAKKKQKRKTTNSRETKTQIPNTKPAKNTPDYITSIVLLPFPTPPIHATPFHHYDSSLSQIIQCQNLTMSCSPPTKLIGRKSSMSTAPAFFGIKQTKFALKLFSNFPLL
jgi:hypothetical protein